MSQFTHDYLAIKGNYHRSRAFVTVEVWFTFGFVEILQLIRMFVLAQHLNFVRK